ncbi:MAG: hypothetical protein ABIK28_16155, partial [Planctomycetota bacterium]
FFTRGTMRRFWRMTVICLIVGLGLSYVFSCSKPTKPIQPKGMRLYWREFWTQNIYVFDPQSKELLDSIKDDYTLLMVLSPNGKDLFTTHDAPPAPGTQTLRKTQTETLEVVGEMPGIGLLLFLKQGEILLRGGLDKIDYIDPVSFQITDTDSIAFYSIASADTAGLIIGSGLSSDWLMTAYNLRNKQILASDSIFIPNGSAVHGISLALHPSGQRGFGIFRDTYQQAWFIDFTVPDFEIEYTYQLYHYSGKIAVSPEGRYVLFNDPGDVWHGDPEDKLFIYDVTGRQMLQVIDLDTLSISQEYPDAFPGSIGFSPDGSTAYFGLTFGPILIYDIENQEFIDLIHPPFNESAPTSFVVGYEPPGAP